MKRFDAIISAGGAAERLDSDRPKSLLQVQSQYLISLTVREIIVAGCQNILILNNRPEWTAVLRSALQGFSAVTIDEDHGYDTTFLLVKGVASQMENEFIFTYGHAPRPADCYRSLMQLGSPSSLGLSMTTKKRPVIFAPDLKLEPPFFLSRESIQVSPSADWQDYFERLRNVVSVLKLDAPSEPNFPEELELYRRYVSLFA